MYMTYMYWITEQSLLMMPAAYIGKHLGKMDFFGHRLALSLSILDGRGVVIKDLFVTKCDCSSYIWQEINVIKFLDWRKYV